MPVIDVMFWGLCEFIVAFIFYNTGVLLIRLFTLGKAAYPFTGSANFSRKDLRLKRAAGCYLAGLGFYLVLALVVINLLNGTGS